MTPEARHARTLARLGFSVLPLDGKRPLTPHGYKDASNDPHQVSTWWTRWPEANIGIATGDVVVLDVDPRNGGDGSLALAVEEHGPLPHTVEVRTGGGGAHYYFRSGDRTIRSRTIAPGLDVKADGGYVVAPPSIHPESGRRYRWVASPTKAELADLPNWLAMVDSNKRPASVLPEVIPEGSRNETLFRWACGHLQDLAGRQSAP